MPGTLGWVDTTPATSPPVAIWLPGVVIRVATPVVAADKSFAANMFERMKRGD